MIIHCEKGCKLGTAQPRCGVLRIRILQEGRGVFCWAPVAVPCLVLLQLQEEDGVFLYASGNRCSVAVVS